MTSVGETADGARSPRAALGRFGEERRPCPVRRPPGHAVPSEPTTIALGPSTIASLAAYAVGPSSRPANTRNQKDRSCTTGEAVITKEQAEHFAERSGVPITYFETSDRSKRRGMAKTFEKLQVVK